MVQHDPWYFEDVPILAFGYTILLRCVSAHEFSPNSFLEKVCRECTGDVFDASLFAFFPKWDIADMPNGVSGVTSPVLT